MAWRSQENLRNLEIYKDSKSLWETNEKLKEAIKETIAKQQIILETDTVTIDDSKLSETPNVVITNRSSFEAAFGYKNEKVCVLNFASSTKAGGGVTNGARAQEECLCRISTLYPCLLEKECQEEFYLPHRDFTSPIYNDDIIYSPDVVVFKDDKATHNLLPEEEWIKVDVLTCAAPNLNKNVSNRYNPGAAGPVKISNDELEEVLKKRYKRILQVAHAEGAEVLILGAFGCGAFKNPARVAAKVFAEVVAECGTWFKKIDFAIPGDTGSGNFYAFKTIGILAFTQKVPL